MLVSAVSSVAVSGVRCSSSESSGPLKRTPLYEAHKKAGAKLVEFGGWEMPVNYPAGVLKEVAACRTSAALFDVSHMGQVRVLGTDTGRFLEKVTVSDATTLAPCQVRYTIMPNQHGGTVDDAMVHAMPAGDHFLVINAGCYDKDMKHLHSMLADGYGPGVQLEPLYKTHALLALQGPAAERILGQLLNESDAAEMQKMGFMTRLPHTVTIGGSVEGVNVTRCGYTGEDGFELSVPVEQAEELSNILIERGGAAWAGLGARDSLRLEAALSLYGHDLNMDISLVEAGLTWTVPKRRKQEGGFIGADAILSEMKRGPARKRVGMVVQGAPARDGADVLGPDGKVIGKVSSGGPSPTLGKNIAMAFIESKYAKVGTNLHVSVRGKAQPVQLVKMPFFPHRYKTN